MRMTKPKSELIRVVEAQIEANLAQIREWGEELEWDEMALFYRIT